MSKSHPADKRKSDGGPKTKFLNGVGTDKRKVRAAGIGIKIAKKRGQSFEVPGAALGS